MLSFDQAMEVTRGVSSAAAFEDIDCAAYFNLLMSLPHRATIVEIGLQFGRSSSIAAQVAKERQFSYVGVDPFTQPPEAAVAWVAMMQRLDVDFTLFKMTSEQAENRLLVAPEMILVDGDHSATGVLRDLYWSHCIRPGGYMCFHDYGRDSLPEVYPTVREYLSQFPEWSEIGTYGTLGVWRKNG